MHFSLSKSQVFMIVKSVEEIIGENQSVGISVMRIYQQIEEQQEDTSQK